MKKILIISSLYFPFHMGGAEVSTQFLAEALSEKYDVYVMSHSILSCREKINNVTVIRQNFGRGTKAIINECKGIKNTIISKVITKFIDIGYSSKTAKVFRTILKEVSPDIILYSGNCIKMGRNTLIQVAKKEHIKQYFIIRDPVFLFFKGMKATNLVLDKLVQKKNAKVIKELDGVIGITKGILDAHISKGISFNKSVIIPNFFSESDKAFVPVNLKSKNILFVGRISKNKGVELLIEAFLQSETIPNENKLILVGELDDVEIPKNERIQYIGKLNLQETYQTMANNYLVVLPSIWEEAFGRVLVESVFNSTICIGSDSGGIPEVLHYDQKYIFEKGNVKSLIKKLEYFYSLNEKEYCYHLEKLKNYFFEFTKDQVLAKYYKIIEN